MLHYLVVYVFLQRLDFSPTTRTCKVRNPHLIQFEIRPLFSTFFVPIRDDWFCSYLSVVWDIIFVIYTHIFLHCRPLDKVFSESTRAREMTTVSTKYDTSNGNSVQREHVYQLQSPPFRTLVRLQRFVLPLFDTLQEFLLLEITTTSPISFQFVFETSLAPVLNMGSPIHG